MKLPKVLQFFTGNIGLHHVHHLNARIPNYNLQRAHDENPIFDDVPTLSLRGRHARSETEAVRHELGRMVTFREAARVAPRADRTAPTLAA